MENSTEDTRRMMAIGRFRWRAGYQYMTTRGGRVVKQQLKPHLYNMEETHLYVIGEEEQAWKELLSRKFKENRLKKLIVKNKSIEKLYECGHSNVDKNGNIVTNGKG